MNDQVHHREGSGFVTNRLFWSTLHTARNRYGISS